MGRKPSSAIVYTWPNSRYYYKLEEGKWYVVGSSYYVPKSDDPCWTPHYVPADQMHDHVRRGNIVEVNCGSQTR